MQQTFQYHASIASQTNKSNGCKMHLSSLPKPNLIAELIIINTFKKMNAPSSCNIRLNNND